MASTCGEGDTFCSRAVQGNYETNLRSDPCAMSTHTSEEEKKADYNLWVPPYRRKTCEGSGYLNCGTNVDRFGPQQVIQESFLQGRGQVVNNPRCPDGGVKYLPESQFGKKSEPKLHDMSLFAQPTTVPRSCNSLTEVDMQVRLQPLPSYYQGSWSPMLDATTAATQTSRLRKAVTLGTREKYPSWAELKAQSEPYS